ncbi:hypothetical protein ES705_11740 [subsurface metagenome]
MKIGRNDPCYCGSGRKHKKCCKELENKLAIINSDNLLTNENKQF